jgi:hypothetical protein
MPASKLLMVASSGVWFEVAVAAGCAAPLGLCSGEAGLALLFRFDGVAVPADALNGRGVEDGGSWDSLGGKSFDVVHLVDAAGASVISELAGLVATLDLILDPLPDA